jgi:hypothetical protein
MPLSGRPKSLSKGTENSSSKDICHFFSGKIITKAVFADNLTAPDLQNTAIICTTCSDVPILILNRKVRTLSRDLIKQRKEMRSISRAFQLMLIASSRKMLIASINFNE